MWGIRANRRLGAWAALFALTVQIVLSFAHVHSYELTTSSPVAAGGSLQQSANRDPAPPAHHDGAHDVCAICATISLLATSVMPEPARLTLPIALSSIWTRGLATATALVDHHVLFQARAPPVTG